MDNPSFFEKLLMKEEFIDRRELTDEEPVDVVIPLKNSNILFERNLKSFYREIPINRLIIGDNGSTDNSIEIIKKFPRVLVIDHKALGYNSLGFRIAKLISLVETEWFVYLHADVYLPDNWFNSMKKYQSEYDYFECDRRYVTLFQYIDPIVKSLKRALSGSQMGRKEAFDKVIPKIDDDYSRRQEDVIFSELLQAENYKYGRIFDTYHYHQIMNKEGGLEPEIKNILIQRIPDRQWQLRVYNMQARGIIKYAKPKPYLIEMVNGALDRLRTLNALNYNQFLEWVKSTNEIWIKHIKVRESFIDKILKKLIRVWIVIFNRLFKKDFYEYSRKFIK